PWAFDGVTLSGETEELTLVQVSAESFIGVNIPGLDGGFELNTFVELDATYRTNEIRIAREDGQLVAGGSITAEDDETSDVYANERAINVSVAPSGEVTYEGVLHLIPAFYIETIGPDFSIPIADIPIPFSFTDKNWDFDPVDVRIPLPDIQLAKDVASTGGGEFPDNPDAPIDLGDIAVGESASVPIALTNEGEAQLVGLVDVAGAGFSVDAGELDVAPSTGATYVVTFSPSEAGAVVGTLTFATNDPDEPLRTLEIHANGLGDPDDEDVTPGDSSPLPDDGCDCSTSSSSSASHGWAALLALGLLASRRKRSR
ncbi:MAG: choice-of-anchor D domain-containing protein, partial [Myxococcales bacterium]|nr:choice-of-anchor D domain-containing protein [Myxococcales bacterium]